MSSPPTKSDPRIVRRLTLTPEGMGKVLNRSPEQVRDLVQYEEQNQPPWNNLEEYAERVAWELVIGNYDVPNLTSTYMIQKINKIKTPDHVWMKDLVTTPT